MNYQTTPAGIAAALRRAADDIEAMGDVELSPLAVTLNIQAVQHKGTSAERIATVDALNVAMVGEPGEVPDGATHHSTPYDAIDKRGYLSVSIYTNPGEYRRGAR